MSSASERICPKLLLGGERNYQFSIVNCRRLLPFLVPDVDVVDGGVTIAYLFLYPTSVGTSYFSIGRGEKQAIVDLYLYD